MSNEVEHDTVSHLINPARGHEPSNGHGHDNNFRLHHTALKSTQFASKIGLRWFPVNPPVNFGEKHGTLKRV